MAEEDLSNRGMSVMKMIIASTIMLCCLSLSAPSSAAFFVVGAKQITNSNDLLDVQYSRGGSREFRRCMRAQYGPRYYHRVPRAHRFHMARACGG
jgi:hypothetical protein